MTPRTGSGPPAGDAVWVVVDSWQQQCCGTDFRLGSSVEWDVRTAPEAIGWLGELLGGEWAERIRYAEEHHGADTDTVRLAGTVVSIHVLTYELEPIPGTERGYQGRPGTGRLTPTAEIDPWGPERRHRRDTVPTQAFGGWVVELRPDP